MGPSTHETSARPSGPGFRAVSIQFVIIFLALAAGVAVSGSLYYERQKDHMRKAVADELSAVADLKVSQILSWRKERLGDVNIICKTPFIVRRITAYLQNPSDPALKKDVEAWMRTLREYYDYAGVGLVGPEGVVHSSGPLTDTRLDRAMARYVDGALASGKPLFTHISSDSPSGKSRLAIVAPIGSGGPGTQGAVILEIDPSRFLYPLVQSWPTPSPSAETVLVRREGDEVVYLSELRHRKGSTLPLRHRLSEAFLPAAMVVNGLRGTVKGLDYRGVKVLAALRDIPGFPWFLVAKIDRDEINAPLWERAVLVMLSVTLLLVVAGFILYYLWRRHTAEIDRRERDSEMRHLSLLKKYELLTRHANDIILVTDRAGRIVDANERAVQFYGYGSEELKGLSMKHLRLPDASEPREWGPKNVHDEEGTLFDATHVRKDGTTCPVEVSLRYIEVEGEGFYQRIVRDISERKETEKRLSRYRDHLEEMVRERTAELEAFSYSVSHDLRAPLRSIDGFSQALMEDCGDSVGEEGRDYLTRIRGASQRMGRLIDDLLKLSRISRAELKFGPVDLSAMVRSISGEMKNGAGDREVELVITDGIQVEGDANLLRVAMENLLGNAFKFTRKREGASIEFGAVAGEDGPVYYVRDNGAGFDMAYAGKLFAPFQRLHSKEEFEGTGIGLATVQRIIRRHRGKIWPESETGKGTVFYFTLHDSTHGRIDGQQDHIAGRG